MMSPKELQWQEKRFYEHYENLTDNPYRLTELGGEVAKALNGENLKLVRGVDD
jgi:hypothetical protein